MNEPSWQELSFVVSANEVEKVSDMLEMFLALAITSENAGDDEFYEVAFPGKPDWKKVTLTALFAADTDLKPIIEFIHDKYHSENQQEIPTQIRKLVDQDWQRVWLDSFKPIKVGTDLWVCPSWCDPVDASQRNIILDPGLAFGTGTHETTNMCLAWLADQDLTDQAVLDYGSGSGILAIAAMLSGASKADAVDIDPLAVEACIENAKRNELSDKVMAFLPENLPTRQYPLVIANILAEVIVELRSTLMSHLQSNGTLLLTGILDTQANKVIEAFGPQFKIEKQIRDQWCLLICRLQ